MTGASGEHGWYWAGRGDGTRECFDIDDPAGTETTGLSVPLPSDESTGESTESSADEITMSSIVVADGAHFDGFEVTDPKDPAPGGGDTRIMEVIQRGDNVEFADALGPIHKGASAMIGRPWTSSRTEPRTSHRTMTLTLRMKTRTSSS